MRPTKIDLELARTQGRKPFYREKYLEDLWTCYDKGVKQEGLPEKDLFIALVRDLIEQLHGEKSHDQRSDRPNALQDGP